MAAVLTEREKVTLAKEKSSIDTTIDNGATFTQLAYLARVITAKNIERHRQSFLQGLDFLLAAQYSNGGFPQFFPLRKGYYSHITYNDGAMIGVLKLLREVAQKQSQYVFVDQERRIRSERAVQSGIACILKTQVLVEGQRTVWAAQHDEITFAPAPARKFEPVALSGGESVEIVRFLMHIAEPNKEIVESVEAAVRWLEQTKLTGIQWLERADKSLERGFDHVVVKQPGAGPLWARFYEIGTNRPIFSGRDGVIKYSVDQIEAERRNGYQWYVDSPQRLLNKDYPEWRRRRSL
jgi:PelA/Pel-15E family pectate lyase